jgi:c-di-GMP-binding flagellar brake protein YcgR
MDVPKAALAAGQRVDLWITSDAGRHLLHSIVEHYEEGGSRLVVAWPTEHSRLVHLTPGQAVELEVVQAGGAPYTRDSVLEGASTEEPPRLTLRLSGAWRRAQRRETVRHVVEMRPSSAIRFAVDGDRVRIDPLVLNLSTGGMRVQCDSELTLDDELELMFATPSGGAQLRLRMTVLHVKRDADGWEAGCQFVESSLGEREQIVGFILAQQRATERA